MILAILDDTVCKATQDFPKETLWLQEKRIWLSLHVLWDLLNIFIPNYNEYYFSYEI